MKHVVVTAAGDRAAGARRGVADRVLGLGAVLPAKGPMVPSAGRRRRIPSWVMEGGGRLELVSANGDSDLVRDAVETGFVVLLEIWHSALGELAGEIPPGQLRVLLIVSRAGSVSIGRLASALGASVPAATRICTRMEAAGLLARSGRAGGRRRRARVLPDCPRPAAGGPDPGAAARRPESRAPVADARGPGGAGERAGRVRRQLRLTGSACRPSSRLGGR